MLEVKRKWGSPHLDYKNNNNKKFQQGQTKKYIYNQEKIWYNTCISKVYYIYIDKNL